MGVCVCPTGGDIPTDKENCKFLLNIRRLGSAWPWVGACPTGRDIPTDKENCKFLLNIRRRCSAWVAWACACVRLGEIFLQKRKTVNFY